MKKDSIQTNCTFVILTGGKSSRMGTDKGLLELSGEKFIDKVLKIVTSFSENILISVGGHNLSGYEGLGYRIIMDEQENKGPIAGIISALHHVSSDWFFVISVDSPFITEELILQLWNNKGGYEAILFSENNKKHPLVALYQVSSKDKWENSLLTSELKVLQVVDSLKCKILPLDPEKAEQLANINTNEEYKSLINSN